MFIPMPPVAVDYPFALIFCMLVIYWLTNRNKSAHLVEIDYNKLSERRRRKARERADTRGFVYLGLGKRVFTRKITFPMSLGEEMVCRVEDDGVRIYEIGNVVDFLKGGGDPKCYGSPFRF